LFQFNISYLFNALANRNNIFSEVPTVYFFKYHLPWALWKGMIFFQQAVSLPSKGENTILASKETTRNVGEKGEPFRKH
jgi:hypothetical protein